ncbi:MAG TPA: pirin family protein [Blastocatellia bacterium]
MINIIRNDRRYHFQSDWLSTYWHFSFDHYYDPANMGFGPLRVFNDDVIRPDSGFGMHGHREMEIITYVIEGELEHRDSTGGQGRIRAGEVQRMSAGTGIRHSEYNPSKDAPVHLLQVWIEPAVRELEPSYEQKQFAASERAGRLLPVASGGDSSGVRIHQDATIYIATIRGGDKIIHRIGEGRRAYLFVIDGRLQLNGQKLERGDQARISGVTELEFASSDAAEIYLIDLP